MDIGKTLKFIRVENGAAAGTTDLTSDFVDTQGYDGVLFITSFGTITAGAVTSVKAQQDTDSGGATAADLLGSAVTVADDDDNQVVVHDIYRPRERYVAIVVDRGTQNAVLDGIVAILYHGSKAPVTNDATTVVALKTLVSVAEGTA